jgi:phosphomevalonate kinase
MNDHDSRIVIVCLNKNWCGEEPTEESVRQSAYHECVELLLSKLNMLIRQRSVLEREVEEEIHVVIRTLENVHFYEDLESRKA